MKTQISNDSPVDITAPSGGTTSGVGVLTGKLFGIAVTTAALGDTVAIITRGVFDHAAAVHATTQAWAVGDEIYWDNSAKVMTKTSSGNVRVGVAMAAKVSTVATGRVRLDGAVTLTGA